MIFIGISIIVLCLINLLNVFRINKLEKLVNFLMNKKIETIIVNAEEYLKKAEEVINNVEDKR